MTTSKQHWSYLAAMIEAEGHITITKSMTTKTSGRTYFPHYQIVIGITNSNVKLMKWLVQYFGGVYYSSDIWKAAHEWRPKGHANKKKLLLGILPYMVFKNEQAKIALAFLELEGQENPTERENLRQQLMQLNQKGKTVTTNTLESSSPEDKIESEHLE